MAVKHDKVPFCLQSTLLRLIRSGDLNYTFNTADGKESSTCHKQCLWSLADIILPL